MSETLFKSKYSFILIKDGKLYVISTKYKDYSPRAVTVVPGFQLELGRSIQDFREALKKTRLPIIIKEAMSKGEKSNYQVIRMHTGSVEDKVVCNIMCVNDIIKTLSFNRALLSDANYRKYTTVSAFHQLALPADLSVSGSTCRSNQVSKMMSAITMVDDITVKEERRMIKAVVTVDDCSTTYNFILEEKTNRYVLSSISI